MSRWVIGLANGQSSYRITSAIVYIAFANCKCLVCGLLTYTWICDRYNNFVILFFLEASKHPLSMFCVIYHLDLGCSIGTGGPGGQGPPPQYFTLESLLIFIHAAQITVLQCILRLASPKWDCFLRLCVAVFIHLIIYHGIAMSKHVLQGSYLLWIMLF